MGDQHKSQPNRELSPKLQSFEAQLASLQPTTGRLERDRLMFEAGKAAAQAARPVPSTAHWAWPAVSTVMTAAAAFLLAVIVLQPGSLVVKDTREPEGEAPERTAGAPDRPAVPSAAGDVSDPDDQEQDTSGTLLASLFCQGDSSYHESGATYLQQRNILLAFDDDRLAELKEPSSAKGGRSNTRVSYLDLLDELTLETHGFATSDGSSGTLKPSSQGTDL